MATEKAAAKKTSRAKKSEGEEKKTAKDAERSASKPKTTKKPAKKPLKQASTISTVMLIFQ